MNVILPALAVAFAAFCLWLAVRIFNRREQWAKWTAVVLASVVIAYPLGFGPVSWMADRGVISETALCAVYEPMARKMAIWCSDSTCNLMCDYANWGSTAAYSTGTIMFAFERVLVRSQVQVVE